MNNVVWLTHVTIRVGISTTFKLKIDAANLRL